MAIRFLCASCNQPIEVDDEWAMRLVACPYCRKTISAPPQSTVEVPSVVPDAQQSPVMAPPPQFAAAAPSLQRQNPNVVALVAVWLAGGVVAAAVVFLATLASHAGELNELAVLMQQSSSIPEMVEATQDYVSSQPSFPLWILALDGAMLLGGVFWLAALVCGLIGVFRPQRRWLAIVSLVICGLAPPVFCCSGGLFQGGVAPASSTAPNSPSSS